MVFGLPATSVPSQVGFEQPRTVMVPVVVPGFVGANGVMLITPVVVAGDLEVVAELAGAGLAGGDEDRAAQHASG